MGDATGLHAPCHGRIVASGDGSILAIVLSLIEVVRRQYKPKDFVLGVSDGGPPTYQQATPGAQRVHPA